MDYEVTAANIGISSPLLSRFDVILILRDMYNEQWDSRVADHILNLYENGASASDHQQPWSLEKLQSHFMAIGEVNPQMSKEASDLLGSYYKYCRNDSYRDPSRTTIRLFDCLIRISKAHARLVFRNDVIEVDAVMAIKLMESSWSFGRLLSPVNILKEDLPLGPSDGLIQEVKHKLTREYSTMNVSVEEQRYQQETIENSQLQSLQFDASSSNRKRQRLDSSNEDAINNPIMQIKSSVSDDVTRLGDDEESVKTNDSEVAIERESLDTNLNGIFADFSEDNENLNCLTDIEPVAPGIFFVDDDSLNDLDF